MTSLMRSRDFTKHVCVELTAIAEFHISLPSSSIEKSAAPKLQISWLVLLSTCMHHMMSQHVRTHLGHDSIIYIL